MSTMSTLTVTGTNNAHYDASEAYDYWESTCNFYDKVGDITTTFTKIGINIEVRYYCRGGSRIYGNGVRAYSVKGMGVSFADFISSSLNIP